MPPEPAPHVSPLIRPWFGMSRGADGKTRVTFVWEPAARVPGRSRARRTRRAAGPDGAVGRRHGAVRGPGAPTGPAAIDEPGGDAGARRVRHAARPAAPADVDSGRGVAGARPGRARDRRSAICAATSRSARPRCCARETRASSARSTPQAAVPVASREFSRTERLLIRFPAYGPGGADPSSRRSCSSRTGQRHARAPGRAVVDARRQRHRPAARRSRRGRLHDRSDGQERRAATRPTAIGFRVTSLQISTLTLRSHGADVDLERLDSYAYIPRMRVTVATRLIATM